MMNKNFKFLMLLTALLIYTGKSFAQLNPIKQYTEDPVVFLQEIKTMFEVTNMDKKEIKDYMEQFTLVWNSPKCNANLKKATYTACNLMVKKKVRILPDYKAYLNSVMNFVNSNQSEANFMAWQGCVEKILAGSIKNYSEYLEMSENLFASNTFYRSSVMTYASNNNNYKFEYEGGAPRVVFPSLNLRIFNNQNDSGVVYNTKGIYYPDKGIFVGEGGKVNWKRTGLEENMVWAELKRYEIVLKTSGYTADSVTFYNKNYFQKPILGRLTEKVVSEKGANISYPRFDSYNKRMPIPDLAKGVDYDGGFSMKGSKFVGSGDKEKDAYLVFKRDGKKFLTVGSKMIGITAEKLTSENANIKIFIGDKDSIVHPSVNAKFIIKDRALSLIRTNSGISKSPFLDSYHKLDMYFEELYWKIDDSNIELRMLVGNTQEDGNFESANYFRNDSYDALQGMDQINPLIALRDYVKKNGGLRDFTGTEYAQYLRLSPRDVLPMLVNLAGFGLISYDAEDDEVHVNEKLFQYIDSRAAKIDYDVIRFGSVVRGSSNATIDLKTNDMSIFGVRQIFMSDSQNVMIFPAEQKILLKKNRDFSFAGVIKAGRFEVFGKDFSFEYDKFILNLPNVDSLRILVKSIEPDAYGEYPMVRVKTVVEKINGSLEIDAPANKSGRKPFSKYPIFSSFKDSYAYYDKKYIQNGKYPREKFYFHLDPFVIDSLDNFTNEGLLLKGEFVSAGIFPTFKETLRLQPDYSLGFVNQSPANGYPAYGGKGTFTNTVKLSNQGLRGDGVLNYITSIAKSNDYIFFPDSTNAIAQTYDVTEQKTDPEFPQVHGEDTKLHWRPYKDYMDVKNNPEKRFAAYNKQSEFTGTLTMTPKLLKGSGTAEFNKAKLDANLIKFKSSTFDSDTADFALKALAEATIAFSTNNVNAHVDFTKRMGEFKSNGKGSIVKFPVNQYICYMESFKWYMDEESVEIGDDKAAASTDSRRDLDLEGPEFISTHPKQDSLRFTAPSAKYDLKRFVISAKNVKYINVADAQIYPDSGNVYVDKNAVMRTFNNAKIVANRVTKYHNLYKCTVNAYGRKSYSGSGSYDYIDELNQKQTFYFSNVSVDTTIQTYAETNIPETAKFKLSPNYDYKGKVKLKASNNFLVFDGSARMDHDCSQIPKAWFKFESEINPNSIYIPVSADPEDTNGKPIAASLMVAKDSSTFYSAFLSNKVSKSDVSVLPSSGYLFYDKTVNEYKISNKEKIVERNMPGNYLSLNTELCKIYGEGKISLGADLGQVKMESYGNATHMLIPDSTKFEMLMSFDFFFDEGAIEKMAEDIMGNKDLVPVEANRPVYEKGMREMLGKDAADKLISQLNLFGSFKKLPDELRKVLVLSDVKMKWNKATRSFNSVGKIGIANVNKTQINKYVDGQIEIQKKRTGDVLTIYLELDFNNWYYFNYTREQMLVVSSNEAFNTIISTLKPDKRRKTGEGDVKSDFEYNLCPPSKKIQFVKKGAPVEE